MGLMAQRFDLEDCKGNGKGNLERATYRLWLRPTLPLRHEPFQEHSGFL